MTRSAYLKIGAISAIYLLWLASWLVLGDQAYGPAQNSWDQASVAAIAGIISFYAARRTHRPYAGFLAFLGVAFVSLAAAWVTYQGSDEAANSDWLYALCVFLFMCAWGYLALDRWHGRPLSLLTTLVFVATIVGLGVIYASFYYPLYRQADTVQVRLYGVTAALEFMVLTTGLLCMLLKESPVVVWIFVGTAILMSGDMAYSVAKPPGAIEPIWMLGQFLLLSAILQMPSARTGGISGAGAATGEEAGAFPRSGLSGMLILLSLGAVLLSPLVWYFPVGRAWKSVSSVLFIAALVIILVWITDRFDDTVAYLRDYVRGVLQSRLVSEDWRSAPARVRAALHSTTLGAFLDDFRDSATRLRRDVLFLGPERLYSPPEVRRGPLSASCFVVMPFGEEWSGGVHRILVEVCKAAGVQAVRGDDLFTPTDILEDIWQSINAADFVIADITGRNPNVLYELGIAHTLAKPVLILSQSSADIPIDLATRRVILYGQGGSDWNEGLAAGVSGAVAKVVEDYGLTVQRGATVSGGIQP